MDYLSPSGLEAIKNHQYVPGCYTPLDNLLNPWWFWATERLPMSMAPNLVTLVGTLHLGVVYGLNWHFTAEGDGTLPPAVMAANAWCLFMYQTLDAMDGKQARRTGNSTPLGQLFDHGCDALGMLRSVARHCSCAPRAPPAAPLLRTAERSHSRRRGVRVQLSVRAECAIRPRSI
jgi:ethanolaminephosphotransferase